jgi:subtilase family serine protease
MRPVRSLMPGWGATIILSLLGCATLPAQTNRITHAVSDVQRTPLQGNVHFKAQPQFDRGVADPDLQLAYMTLLIKKSPAQQAELDQLLADQQNPSSPRYHEWLSPEQYADRFGASPSDVQTIVDWLTQQRFSVHEVAPTRSYIAFGGSAATVGTAFQTEIHRYEVNGVMHYANATEPSVPEAFADLVLGIHGLDDFRPEPPHAAGKALPDSNAVQPAFQPPQYLTPYYVASLYDVISLCQPNQCGQNLAILGQTDISQQDIALFRQNMGLRPLNLAPILVPYSPDPGKSAADLPEAEMDIEWSGAMAPYATVTYVYSQDVYTSAQYAITHNVAPVMSYSYGECEKQASPSRTFAVRGVREG